MGKKVLTDMIKKGGNFFLKVRVLSFKNMKNVLFCTKHNFLIKLKYKTWIRIQGPQKCGSNADPDPKPWNKSEQDMNLHTFIRSLEL